MGYRKLDEANTIPNNHNITSPNDPYPVLIFNEEKVIPDNKIGQYINDEFNYYLNIYENNKLFGIPFKNWTEMPVWLIELHKMFEHIDNEYEVYQLNKSRKHN